MHTSNDFCCTGAFKSCLQLILITTKTHWIKTKWKQVMPGLIFRAMWKAVLWEMFKCSKSIVGISLWCTKRNGVEIWDEKRRKQLQKKSKYSHTVSYLILPKQESLTLERVIPETVQAQSNKHTRSDADWLEGQLFAHPRRKEGLLYS